jgi:predicted CoA-substrate-specific enzyme activase
MSQYIAGIDVGASAVKVVIINDKKEVMARALRKTGVDIINSARSALDEAKGAITNPIKIVATGFGRSNLPFVQGAITEISAHSKGVYYYFPKALTIIDIGAQDNKVIHLDESGRMISFKMNRKCAAGTGAFLEEIAYKMDIPIAELNGLAKRSNPVELGSYCTVFSATEILSRIREGKKKEDIIRGVYSSVVKRIIEMDPLQGQAAITGGVVAYNDVIVDLLKKYTLKDVLIPPMAQFTGALGAALIAMEK